MESTGSVFSQTLQEITNTKLDGLSEMRDAFEKQKSLAITDANNKGAVDMLATLAAGVKACFAVPTKSGRVIRGSTKNPKLEIDLRNLDRFLDQARFDASISHSIIDQWKQLLLKHLELQSSKYSYASLYGQLTVEWLSNAKAAAEGSGEDDMQLSEDFEQIEARSKLEARQRWEQQVFESAQVDEKAIDEFLHSLVATKEAQKAFQDAREGVQDFQTSLTSTGQINRHSLKWVISGLLRSDLLSDEKRQVLRDFQSNNVVLTEIADVLDMRMTALQSWTWGSEVPLEQRRQLNGTYNIYMHEDLLQAMFLQFIGVKWSVFFKNTFRNLFSAKDVWKSSQQSVPLREKERMEDFLGDYSEHRTVQSIRQSIYLQEYFASQLLDDEDQDVGVEEGEVEADFGLGPVQAPASLRTVQQPPRQTRMKQTARVTSTAPGFRKHSDLFYDDESGFDGNYRPKNPMDAKQRLLHLLSTDILIKTSLEGDLTCFRSQYDTWNPSLPHETIKTVLSFFGVTSKWLKFFQTFLQAPLKFIEDNCEPRLRKRGTPGAHVLSDVFGEIILFCLDFAINQRTGGEPLWRVHDDFWFWSSSHQKCVVAWNTIEQFNQVMGVSLDHAKTGAVRLQGKNGSVVPADLGPSLPKGDIRWGMLYLNPQSGSFEIDRDMVDKHIDELSRQLKDKEQSIFAWVKAYSTYASVFFTSNFGKPANCFGRKHVDMMLSTQERIQRTLFASSPTGVDSVVDWLKHQINQRFGVSDIPDGYLFFPTELGGLEVKSPFIGLLQIRDSVTERPAALLEKFQEAERDAYNASKKEFEERRDLDGDNCMSFKEYTKYREQLNYGYTNQLMDVYRKLLKRPKEETIDFDDGGTVKIALNGLGRQDTLKSITSDWYKMEPYWQWVAQLYGPGIIEKFGGFNIVDPGSLPIGMVSLFRSGRVKWQE